MRRGSIAGPLLLIAVGLLFLLRNFIPFFEFGRLVVDYWPYLLIGWGVLRAVEVIVWHQRGTLPMRRGMSGGEWVLVWVIIIVGSSFFWARNSRFFPANGFQIGAWDLMGDSYDFPISGTVQAGKAPRIIIDNPRGNARITGVDSEEVRVTGTKSFRAISREEADKNQASAPFELRRNGDQIIVATNLDRLNQGRSARVEMELLVPKGSSIETRGHHYGDFEISNLDGTVDVVSDNAGVRVTNVGGNVKVDLRRSDSVHVTNARGSVQVKGHGQDLEFDTVAGPVSVDGEYSGEMSYRKLDKGMRFESKNTSFRVEKVAGEVRMVLGNLNGHDLTGPIQLNTKSKDVNLSDFTQAAAIEVERGDIQLRPGKAPLGKMDIHTRNGEIGLSLPADAKFELLAEARRGEIDNEYGSALSLVERDHGAKLSGTVGSGPQLILRTDRGPIKVWKGSAPEKERPKLEITRQ